MPRGGTPPLVPMWPGVRVTEQNPFPFFPFDPRWRQGFSSLDLQTFCALLRMAWVSPRPCFLSADASVLNHTLHRLGHPSASERVLAQFSRHKQTGLLYFPPQLRALGRLVRGEDLYALLWDEEL
ncbi:MAG: hypothetical protein AB7O65_06390 [Candidatus Korobacteraceae bacterium]